MRTDWSLIILMYDELLANCLMRLLSDEKMYSEMSAKAIKKSAGFSVSRVSDMYMSIFKKVLGGE